MAVYFIRAGDFVKIGFSQDPESRKSGLQSSCPLTLELLFTEPGSRQLESKLHMYFKDHRVHHEWFTLSSDIQIYIENRKQGKKIFPNRNIDELANWIEDIPLAKAKPKPVSTPKRVRLPNPCEGLTVDEILADVL